MSDFRPQAHLRKLRGRGGDADYLDVKWRIVWLRQEHPDCAIETEKIAGGMESNYAEFKARVSIPGKGSATGHGSESKADFGDFIEKAETKAIGRAIAALGYGTQFVGNELDEGERIMDSPVEPTPARQSRSTPQPPGTRPAAVTPAAGPPPLAAQEGPGDDELVAVVSDDLKDPDARWDALWDFYDRAEDVADLNRRVERVKASGMPQRDLAAAYKQVHQRLAQAFAPAKVPAPAGYAG